MGAKPSSFVDVDPWPRSDTKTARRKQQARERSLRNLAKKPQHAPGASTLEERALIATAVAEHAGAVPSSVTEALAKDMGRSVSAVKNMIRLARHRFLQNADRYAEIHMQTTELALNLATDTEAGEKLRAGALGEARKGSEWALENISGEGESVVERVKQDPNSGIRVMVGIKLGGMRDAEVSEEPVVTAESVTEETPRS